MIKFKKIFLGSVVLSSALLLGLAQTPQVLHAADAYGPGDAGTNLSANGETAVSGETVFTATDTNNEAHAKSTAEFKVIPGTLQLVAVPDLNFGSVDAKTVIEGGEKALEDNTVTTPGPSKNNPAWDGNNKGVVRVDDYRGNNKGWQLNLEMSDFRSTGGLTIPNVTLDVNDPNGKNSVEAGGSYSLLGTGIYASTELTNVAPTHGIARTTYKLTSPTGNKLTFPGGAATFELNTPYQADLTWTLVAGA